MSMIDRDRLVNALGCTAYADGWSGNEQFVGGGRARWAIEPRNMHVRKMLLGPCLHARTPQQVPQPALDAFLKPVRVARPVRVTPETR